MPPLFSYTVQYLDQNLSHRKHTVMICRRKEESKEERRDTGEEGGMEGGRERNNC